MAAKTTKAKWQKVPASEEYDAMFGLEGTAYYVTQLAFPYNGVKAVASYYKFDKRGQLTASVELKECKSVAEAKAEVMRHRAKNPRTLTKQQAKELASLL